MTKSSLSFFRRSLNAVRAGARAETHRRALRLTLLDNPEIKAVFNTFPPALRSKVWLSHADYSDEVRIGLTLEDLPSFKAPVLQRLLERFLKPEWHATTQDWMNGQPNRDFKFDKEITVTFPENNKHVRWLRDNGRGYMVPTEMRINVSIYAYVKADSPTCRVVVTGVKERVIREETKEIVCA
jgi:hypothetical protein